MMNTDEFKLASLGLKANQISLVLQRIQGKAVDDFVRKWNEEKKMGNLNNYPNQQARNLNQNDRGLYETRKNNVVVSPAYDRAQDLRKTTIGKDSSLHYMDRMLPNSTHRVSSEEMQQMYQEKSQSRTNPSANLDIMSAQLFGEKPNGGYTASYLHKKYKQLSLSLHPDKRGGDASAFNMLTTCYNHLKSSLTIESEYIETAPKPREIHAVPPPDALYDNKFNPKVFNEYYSKNAFKEESGGYGDWLKSQPDIKQKTRPSESNFNSAYESEKQLLSRTLDPSMMQLIKTPEIPQELNSNNHGSMIGGEEDGDFSGETANGTKYTDLRRALQFTHLTYDTEPVKEGNVSKDFAAAKQNLGAKPSKLTPAEEQNIQDLKLRQQEAEEMRRWRVSQYDEDVQSHFQKTHSNRLTMG